MPIRKRQNAIVNGPDHAGATSNINERVGGKDERIDYTECLDSLDQDEILNELQIRSMNQTNRVASVISWLCLASAQVSLLLMAFSHSNHESKATLFCLALLHILTASIASDCKDVWQHCIDNINISITPRSSFDWKALFGTVGTIIHGISYSGRVFVKIYAADDLMPMMISMINTFTLFSSLWLRIDTFDTINKWESLASFKYKYQSL